MDTCLYNYVVLSYVYAYVHEYRNNKDRKQDGSLIMATL